MVVLLLKIDGWNSGELSGITQNDLKEWKGSAVIEKKVSITEISTIATDETPEHRRELQLPSSLHRMTRLL
jgi:hypothetical protein